MSIPGEILMELHSMGEAPPQCVVCNHAADWKCGMPDCGEFLCADHARACEFCKVSECAPLNHLLIRFCEAHAVEVGRKSYICCEHKADFEAEAARLLLDQLVCDEVMA